MYSHEDLIMSVFNLFGAGTVTTSNTLVFFLLMLAKHPHIQGMAAKHSCSVPEELMGQRVPALEDPVWGQTKIIPWGHPRVGAVRYRFPQAGGIRVLLPVLHPCPCRWPCTGLWEML